MPGSSTAVAVVHLVHARNPIEVVERFAGSYARHQAGLAHDLVLALKGFGRDAPSGGRADRRAALDLFADIPHRTLVVPDDASDISTYRFCTSVLGVEHLCLLNSFSVIRATGWLAKLHGALIEGGFGAVGATASYESPRANRALPGLSERSSPLRLAVRRARDWRSFPPFPNPHLRTNGLLIPRSTALQLRWGSLRDRGAARMFEAGRRSLSRQLLGMGMRLGVVDSAGRAWSMEEWPQSRTFRLGMQENLLIADNRTLEFDSAEDQSRRLLQTAAWGAG